jgi:hypothetical protein
MHRLFIRVLLFNGAIFIAALLITSQPYQNPAEMFFGEQECQMPCWQGIRPGESSRADIEAFLQSHAWIDQSSLSNSSRISDATAAFYQWRWSAQFPFPPPFIDDALAIVDGMVGISSGTTRADGVDRLMTLRVSTHLRVADLWLLFGPPQAFTSAYLTTDITLHEMTLFTLGGSGINITAHQQCPLNLRTLLESPVSISIATPGQISPARPSPLRTLFELMVMRNAQLCQA